MKAPEPYAPGDRVRVVRGKYFGCYTVHMVKTSHAGLVWLWLEGIAAGPVLASFVERIA